MFTLGRDVINLIFSFLDNSDIGRFGRLNKRGYELSRCDRLWQTRITQIIPISIALEYKGKRTWYNYFSEDLSFVKQCANDIIRLNSHRKGRRDKVLLAMSMIPEPIRLVPRRAHYGPPGCEYVYQRGRMKGTQCNEPFANDGSVGSDRYCRNCLRKLTVRRRLGIV